MSQNFNEPRKEPPLPIPRTRQTHTFATLEVSAAAYDEIAAKLREAEYDHAFMSGGAIDMHGIGLIRENTENSQHGKELETPK